MSSITDLAKKGDDIIVGGGSFQDTISGQTSYVLSIFNLKTRSYSLINLDFLPHGISPHPTLPHHILICEKIGPGAAIVDIENTSIITKVEADDKKLFYGHCAFSSEGDIFYTTETYKDSLKGAIVIRDSQTREILGEFPSYGSSPHECYLIDNGNTMVVTNGGEDIKGDKPNISYIDINSQRLIRQEFLTNRHINAGHLMLANNDSLIVVSAPRAGLSPDKLGGVSIQPAGKGMKSVSSPKKVVSSMKGEALSVAIHEDKALVTHPNGNMLTIWSLDDRRLIKKIDLPKPRGVTLTRLKDNFVVSFGDQANIIQINTESLEPLKHTLSHSSYLTGSHLYNWSELSGIN
jgi:hypothetical protein